MIASSGLSVLFALPRSRSTAFFRAMSTISELMCIHEPFCTLTDTGSVELPNGKGGNDTLHSKEAVASHICKLAESRKVFVKETTDNDLMWLVSTKFCAPDVSIAFLVRAPEPAIASHLRMRAEAELEDFGFGHLRQLMIKIRTTGRDIVLYQSEELERDPALCLEDFCTKTGLPYSPAMLTWKPEDRREWRRTGSWHRIVAQSTGFCKTVPTGSAPHALVNAVSSDYRAILEMG